MRAFGFSTGALAKGDFQRALTISKEHSVEAVEFSALRIEELAVLVTYLLAHGIGQYRYASFHAPSQFSEAQEETVVSLLKQIVEKLNIPIIVHPDCIHDWALWRSFGGNLCIENMDHRKPVGRTARELARVFDRLPDARLCFDIGHAHEIDRSMLEAFTILKTYKDRLVQVHASEVSDQCEHRPFSFSSTAAFKELAELIPENIPVILETVTHEEGVGEQLRTAKDIFRAASAKIILSGQV